MLINIIRKIYRVIAFPFRIYLPRINYIKNFTLLNIMFIITKRVQLNGFALVNQKTYLTGLGKVIIGKECSFGYKLGGFYHKGSIEFQPRYKNAIIKIGNNVSTNNNLFFCAANNIEIGDDCLIGQNVTIMDFEAHGIDLSNRNEIGEIGFVKIGKNVWIGNNVTILKNSEVGRNSIVATGAVVIGSFPENVIIGGVPAKIIRTL